MTIKKYEYTPKYVCSRLMEIWIKDDTIIHKVKITGGCAGNTVGVSKLSENRKIDEVANIIQGIPCGNKLSSCPDQLATALEMIKNGELQPTETIKE